VPGCRGGCRGLWLNVITNQPASDFTSQTKYPIIRLTHGGDASYRNALGQIVQYRVGPAVMVGETLPNGFTFKPGETSTIMLAHVNLAGGAEPDPNLKTNNFVNRSVATSKWAIEIDLNEGTNKNLLQLNQIRDIEIRFDTTYLTLPQFANVTAASQRMHEAEAAGQEVTAADAALVENWQASQHSRDLVQAAAAQAAQVALVDSCRLSAPVKGELYMGSLTLTDPVVLGRTDIGFDLHINADNSIIGHLRPECSPLFDRAVALAGNYNPATRALTVQNSEPLTRTLASRVAQRTIQISGVLSTTGLLDGQYSETITGYTQKAMVSHGVMTVSRPANDNFAAAAAVNHPPALTVDNFTVAAGSSNNSFNVLANDSDPDGQSLAVVTVGAPQHGVATRNGNAILYTPATGYNGADSFVYSVSDGSLTSVATINVTVGSGAAATNMAPVAKNQTVAARPGQARAITLAGTDANGDGLTFALVTQPALPVLDLRMEELPGATNFVDSAGNGNNAVCGSATQCPTAGAPGGVDANNLAIGTPASDNALTFNSNQYLRVPNNATLAFDANRSFTWLTWVKTTIGSPIMRKGLGNANNLLLSITNDTGRVNAQHF
jgi:hypothetical protein